MSIKVGTKMLYCNNEGDKSSEEIVEVIAVHPESASGDVTIYIPSLNREMDTELFRLSPIKTLKAKPKKTISEEERMLLKNVRALQKPRKSVQRTMDVVCDLIENKNAEYDDILKIISNDSFLEDVLSLDYPTVFGQGKF